MARERRLVAAMTADVDGDRMGVADRGDLAFLQDAQERGLRRRRQLAHLVEEEGAAVGAAHQARAAVERAGEGALPVAEERGLEEAGGERGTVDGDERPAAARSARAACARAPPCPRRSRRAAGWAARRPRCGAARRRPGPAPGSGSRDRRPPGLAEEASRPGTSSPEGPQPAAVERNSRKVRPSSSTAPSSSGACWTAAPPRSVPFREPRSVTAQPC